MMSPEDIGDVKHLVEMSHSGRAGVSGSRGGYCSRHVDSDRDIATDAVAVIE